MIPLDISSIIIAIKICNKIKDQAIIASENNHLYQGIAKSAHSTKLQIEAIQDETEIQNSLKHAVEKLKEVSSMIDTSLEKYYQRRRCCQAFRVFERFVNAKNSRDEAKNIQKTLDEGWTELQVALKTLSLQKQLDQVCKHLPRLSSNIESFNIKNFLARDQITDKITQKLSQQGSICILHGPEGVGKSSLAIHYGKTCKNQQVVRLVNSSNLSALQFDLEGMAQELDIDLTVMKYLSQSQNLENYLLKLSYRLHSVMNEGPIQTILIFDKVYNTNLMRLLLESKSDLISVIVTTRNPFFIGDQNKHEEIEVSAFSQQEAIEYVQNSLAAMKRSYNKNDVEKLINIVGLVPSKLYAALEQLSQQFALSYDEFLVFFRDQHQLNISKTIENPKTYFFKRGR